MLVTAGEDAKGDTNTGSCWRPDNFGLVPSPGPRCADTKSGARNVKENAERWNGELYRMSDAICNAAFWPL
jgi:hypothetical protein